MHISMRLLFTVRIKLKLLALKSKKIDKRVYG